MLLLIPTLFILLAAPTPTPTHTLSSAVADELQRSHVSCSGRVVIGAPLVNQRGNVNNPTTVNTPRVLRQHGQGTPPHSIANNIGHPTPTQTTGWTINRIFPLVLLVTASLSTPPLRPPPHTHTHTKALNLQPCSCQAVSVEVRLQHWKAPMLQSHLN